MATRETKKKQCGGDELSQVREVWAATVGKDTVRSVQKRAVGEVQCSEWQHDRSARVKC